MRLIIVRHALAEEREEFAKTNQPDSLRPLTANGKKKMQKLAKKFVDLIGPVDVILTSPFTRAQQTTEILSETFPAAPITETAELKPRIASEVLLKRLGSLKNDLETVMIVGHEPQLSRFATFMLTGASDSKFNLKKSGMICFEFSSLKDLLQRKVQISWMLSPKCV